jgi:hypothetical protein
MRKTLLSLSALSLIIPMTAAFAQSASPVITPAPIVYDTSGISRYTDTAQWDRSTQIAVSVLTKMSIVQGDPSGTFRASDTLNRAEFMQIVMRLLPPAGSEQIFMHCFPDVLPGIWYEYPVCRAKSLGIVRGNVNTAVDPINWPFQPSRDVQYEEAVKVLVKINAFPAQEVNGDQWYVPFMNAAHEKGVDLPGLIVGDRITRGEMAELVLNFLAYSNGTLDAMHAAQLGSSSSSSISSHSSSSSTSSHSSSSSTSSMSSGSASTDSLPDRNVQSNILLLGTTTPILAGAQFFSNNEPIAVTSFIVNMQSPVSSLDALLVYNSSGVLLGTATLQPGSTTAYKANVKTNAMTLPYRANRSIYVRARLKAHDSGGVSGENVQVSGIEVDGNGMWTNESYVSSSSDSFLQSQTARGVITAVTNTAASSQLISGASDQLLGAFQFTATTSDSQAKVRLTQLVLTANATGGVSVSNVQLRTDGGSSTSCTVSTNVITCPSIPSDIGTVSGTQKINVYGDVSVPSNATNPTLTLSINNPGIPSSAGDITWTDGEATFTWLPLSTPVVRGTQFQ